MQTGKIAFINLNKKAVVMEDTPRDWQLKYLGARGVNAYLLYSLVDASFDPLGPENPLIFGTGLLTASPGFGSGRLDVTALSPECGNLGSSNIGGQFGAELKFAGFDHLVIRGKSDVPVYILIRNDDIQIRDARHLWGKDTWETQVAIKEENRDDRMKVAAIGPAGENLVRYANIMTGRKDAAGRFGMGAVMGSKNVKAIAVRGTKDVEIAHPKELMAYYKAEIDRLMARKWTQAFSRYGTLNLVVSMNEWGTASTRNEQGPPMGERGRALYPQNIDRYALGMSSCFGCVVHCRHRYVVKEGPYAGTRSEGPDFGTLAAFGYNPDIPDFEFVLYCNDVCNRLGLDVSDSGTMIGLAIELYQGGIIGKQDVGRALEWGDKDTVLSMLEAIVHRDGLGDILADGPYALNRLPAEAKQHLALVRNAITGEMGARAYPGFALARAVSTLAGHIHRNHPALSLMRIPGEVFDSIYGTHIDPDPTSPVGKAVVIRWHELLNAVCDSLGFCRFQSAMNSPRAPKFEEYSQLISLAAGLDMSVPKLMEIGERIDTTERLLLGKLGVGSRQDDALPERWFTEPVPHGAQEGAALDREVFEQLLDEYYALRGWDENGIPTPETVERLGITEAEIGDRWL
ncbi:MAG: aldehyde ferredoxin oxidoreductase family protein [Dehalococcoidia bacterium]